MGAILDEGESAKPMSFWLKELLHDQVAACQYHIDLLTSWDAYAEHLTELCEALSGRRVALLLPEYVGLVLTGQLPEAQRSDLHGSILPASRRCCRALVELCESLAKRLQIYLQPGSVAVLDDDGLYLARLAVRPAGLPGQPGQADDDPLRTGAVAGLRRRLTKGIQRAAELAGHPLILLRQRCCWRTLAGR